MGSWLWCACVRACACARVPGPSRCPCSARFARARLRANAQGSHRPHQTARAPEKTSRHASHAEKAVYSVSGIWKPRSLAGVQCMRGKCAFRDIARARAHIVHCLAPYLAHARTHSLTRTP
eukprot:2816546-Pleurochrysis_carterae.AAC.2